MKRVIYLYRVSTIGQVDHDDIPMQKLACREYAATHPDWKIGDEINEFYPTKYDKAEWQWRTPFRTETLDFENLDDKDGVFAKLDSLIPVIHEFEEDLRSKL